MMDWRSIMRMPFGAMMPPAPGGGTPGAGGQPGGAPIPGMLSHMLMPGWQSQFNRPAPQQQAPQTPAAAPAPAVDPWAAYYSNFTNVGP
ncbi:hypothetical protein [Reyranella sp. CPCC 100927]|uniref:hypothetical protein n=1 Tax=Reyranella sp. CPCC 100927 TaxID=2599616 RepID=UPI0011B5BF47|nr:hypothetical protein [Reyranella sp. CPCC 100927]TWT11716.1 hypothetical protein FQU96_14675 [Reyranella sp. CPCC 100927]